MALPRDGATYCPRRVVESRQGKAVVLGSKEVSSPSQASSVANISQSTPGYGILKCKNKRCLICPKPNTKTNFLSNVILKTYNIKNHPRGNISCHSQNLIYLLTFKDWNIQYIGQIALPLGKRTNIHHKSKSGSEHAIKYFKNDCAGWYFVI